MVSEIWIIIKCFWLFVQVFVCVHTCTVDVLLSEFVCFFVSFLFIPTVYIVLCFLRDFEFHNNFSICGICQELNCSVWNKLLLWRTCLTINLDSLGWWAEFLSIFPGNRRGTYFFSNGHQLTLMSLKCGVYSVPD